MRRAARPTSIAGAAEGTVRLTGTVRAIGDTLIAPLTGRRAVVFDVLVEAPARDARRGLNAFRARAAVSAARETRGGSFLIDDGSGAALVQLDGRDVLKRGTIGLECAIARDYRNSLLLVQQARRLLGIPARAAHGDDAPGAAVDRFLERHELHVEADAPVHYEEGIIAEGDRVTVVGLAYWEPHAGGDAQLYRASPRRLVMRGTDDAPVMVVRAPRRATGRSAGGG